MSFSCSHFLLMSQTPWMRFPIFLKCSLKFDISYFNLTLHINHLTRSAPLVVDTGLLMCNNSSSHVCALCYFTRNNWASKPSSFLPSLHKRWSFPLKISSVIVTKSAVSCVFGYIYWRNPCWKISFFMQGMFSVNLNHWWIHQLL